MKYKYKNLLLLLCIFTTFAACKKSSNESLWKTDILAPLVQSSLTIKNIIRDTALVKINADNSMRVVSRQEIASLTQDSLVTLKVRTFYKKVKLSSLVLDSQTVVRNVTLGELARSLIATGNFTNVLIGSSILSGQGTTNSIPPINNLTASNLPLDIRQFFDQATFLAGDMVIKIQNNLPLTVSNIRFDVRNPIAGTTVADETFTNISTGQSQTRIVDLAGKSVEGNLSLNLLDLDLAGGTVVIDTNNAISISITVKNVSLQSATAVFPEQTVIDQIEREPLDGTNDARLVQAILADGSMVAEVNNSAKIDVLVQYDIPCASKNGIPFSATRTVPGSSNGQVVKTVFNEDLKDYVIDLRGPNLDTVNTFYNRLIGKIPFTGQKVFLSLNDSLDVTVNLVGAKASYVKGYLGRDTLNIGPAVTTLDLFKNIESGTLNFENSKISMVVENGLGIDGSVKINSVTARNTKTGATQTLSGPNVGNVLAILRATDNPLSPATSVLDISTGSNATSLLNILPNEFVYDVQVIANPAGFTNTYNDFAYDSSGLKAYLDIEIPLSFLASDLVLSDTATFGGASLTRKSVSAGTFTVAADNGFPLEAGLKIYFLNSSGVLLDSLISPQVIEAATVNASNRVVEKRKSTISYEVDEQKMATIYGSSFAIFKARFTTRPDAAYLKIYSDYSIDFKLIGNMEYGVGR